MVATLVGGLAVAGVLLIVAPSLLGYIIIGIGPIILFSVLMGLRDL